MAFDSESLDRIKQSVVWTEQQRGGTGMGPVAGRGIVQPLLFGVLAENIVKGATGACDIKASIKVPGGEAVRTVDVYNWGCDQTEGNLVIIAYVTGVWTILSAVKES